MVADADDLVRDGVQGRQDVVAFPTRWPRYEQPHQAPQASQERSEHEVGGIDEQDRPLAPLGLAQPRSQFVLEERGLLLGVGLGRDGPYLAPAQANFFFKKARTWDRPRRIPVCCSMASRA